MKLSFVLSLLFVFQSFGITITIDYSLDEPIFKSTHQAELSKSVGENFISFLELKKIPYEGSFEGINSLFNVPKKSTAQDGVTKYFGWCYSINGKLSDAYGADVYFESQNDHLHWFYGYAALLPDGTWSEMCLPAFKR